MTDLLEAIDARIERSAGLLAAYLAAAGRAALPDPPEAFLCPDCGHIGDAVSRIDRACVNHPPGERRPMVRLRSRADAERLAAALPDPPTARDIAQAFKDGDHQRGIVLASEAKAAALPDERLREALREIEAALRDKARPFTDEQLPTYVLGLPDVMEVVRFVLAVPARPLPSWKPDA